MAKSTLYIAFLSALMLLSWRCSREAEVVWPINAGSMSWLPDTLVQIPYYNVMDETDSLHMFYGAFEESNVELAEEEFAQRIEIYLQIQDGAEDVLLSFRASLQAGRETALDLLQFHQGIDLRLEIQNLPDAMPGEQTEFYEVYELAGDTLNDVFVHEQGFDEPYLIYRQGEIMGFRGPNQTFYKK